MAMHACGSLDLAGGLDEQRGVAGRGSAVARRAAGVAALRRSRRGLRQGVKGHFRTIKWAALVVLLGIYYVTPWLRWDRGPDAPNQAVLADMAGGRLYFFGIEIWPQEIYYPDRHPDAGRLRPVPRDLAVRPAVVRLRLPADGLDRPVHAGRALDRGRPGASGSASTRRRGRAAKWRKRVAQACGLAADRVPAPAAPGSCTSATRPPWSASSSPGRPGSAIYFFVVLFTATTYVLAGMAREQVCTYMCPWPRIQGALVDRDTMAVTYEAWRGEPRGKYRKGESFDGRGDCIDCKQCVAVCPTGVDIRDGFQLECIGCGLCIDACDEVMGKIGRPPKLIAYDSERNQELRAAGKAPAYRLAPAAHPALRRR